LQVLNTSSAYTQHFWRELFIQTPLRFPIAGCRFFNQLLFVFVKGYDFQDL